MTITAGELRKSHSDGSGYEYKRDNGKSATYDKIGRMTGSGNRKGKVWTAKYPEIQGEKISILDNTDREVMTIEKSGNTETVTDINGRKTRYIANDSGQLAEFQNISSDGEVASTTIQYDSNGRISKLTMPGDRERTIEYVGESEIVSSIKNEDNIGSELTVDFNKNTKLYHNIVKSPEGTISEKWLDTKGNVKRKDINGITTDKYYRDDRKLTHVDGKDNVTVTNYDEFKNTTSRVYPDGSTEQFAYETSYRNLTRYTDPKGNVTKYDYNDKGLITKKTEAIGTTVEKVTEYKYEDTRDPSWLTSVTQVGDTSTETATTSYEYDDLGRKTKIISPMSKETLLGGYEGCNCNKTQVTNPAGKDTYYHYDDFNRLKKVTTPDDKFAQFEYDITGNQTAIIDKKGNRTEMNYNKSGKLTSIKYASDAVTKSIYDNEGRLIKVIANSGAETNISYDSYGRLSKKFDSEDNKLKYIYDTSKASNAAYNQPVEIQYNGNTKKFFYDKMGRVIKTMNIVDGKNVSTKTVYDVSGNIIESIDKFGHSTKHKYDALNRLTETLDPNGNTTIRAYDKRNNLLSVTDSNDNKVSYKYDKENKQIEETDVYGRITKIEYNDINQIKSKVSSFGRKIIYEYDDIGNLIKVILFDNETDVVPFITLVQTYDDNGNLLTVTNTIKD